MVDKYRVTDRSPGGAGVTIGWYLSIAHGCVGHLGWYLGWVLELWQKL